MLRDVDAVVVRDKLGDVESVIVAELEPDMLTVELLVLYWLELNETDAVVDILMLAEVDKVAEALEVSEELMEEEAE